MSDIEQILTIKLNHHNEERNPKMVNSKPEEKDEFIQYFLQTVELTKKIFPHISHLRESGEVSGSLF